MPLRKAVYDGRFSRGQILLHFRSKDHVWFEVKASDSAIALNSTSVLLVHREGYMFHQINLRSQSMGAITTTDGTQVQSLYQAWVEQAVQEFERLCTWPLVTLKQGDLVTAFTDRMTRNKCNYTLTWTIASGKITKVKVGTIGNTCTVAIPVTIPGGVTSPGSLRTE
jgi:hypothetical protein